MELVGPRSKESYFEKVGSPMWCWLETPKQPFSPLDLTTPLFSPLSCHQHQPLRDLGGVTTTCAHCSQSSLWTLRGHVTRLQPCLMAVLLNQGAGEDMPIHTPTLIQLQKLKQPHHLALPLKATVQNQSCPHRHLQVNMPTSVPRGRPIHIVLTADPEVAQ